MVGLYGRISTGLNLLISQWYDLTGASRILVIPLPPTHKTDYNLNKNEILTIETFSNGQTFFPVLVSSLQNLDL